MNPTNGQNQQRSGLTRREFFTRPFVWMMREPATPEQGKVIPCRLPLSALKDIPEGVLMLMTPVLRQGWTVRFCGTGIAYCGDEGQKGFVTLEQDCYAAAQLFDGTRTLTQAAELLNAKGGTSQESMGAVVRKAFLALAMEEVYHPSAPLGALPAIPLNEV